MLNTKQQQQRVSNHIFFCVGKNQPYQSHRKGPKVFKASLSLMCGCAAAGAVNAARHVAVFKVTL